jgi:diguanylate cyclase (GGDEF)-like protein
MEPTTVFILGSLMMLANGGVLGLMHQDLPESLRPAAVSWRIATLLHACGCLLFAAQHFIPVALVLPLANGLVMFGFTGYWYSLRQFYAQPSSLWLMLPACIGMAGVLWFATVMPDTGIRIMIVSAVWLLILPGTVKVLLSEQRHDQAISRKVMAAIFSFVCAFVLFRAGYFVWTEVHADFRVIDQQHWLNLVSPMVIAILPVIGTTTFLLMCSERIRRQWEKAAATDYLTGLANRRTLTEQGLLWFEQAKKTQRPLAVAVIDIDHFKTVNDRYGHDTGDLALQYVAAQLVAHCRSTELPARQGGEEFVVLLQNVSAEEMRAAAERLRQGIAEKAFIAADLVLPLTVSIGVALQDPADSCFSHLMQRADKALYQAKAAGRNQVIAG